MTTLTVGAAGPLHGIVSVPGDKSISHRAVLLAALAHGRSRVGNFLNSADCEATLSVTRALGVQHHVAGPYLYVDGAGLHSLQEPGGMLDCGGSGTTMRLLAGILAGQPFLSILAGNAALSRRPMDRVAAPLRLMGATVLARQGGRLPPLVIQGGQIQGISYDMPVASAQVKSALLLAGLFAAGPTTVRERQPSRDHTELMLRALGAPVQQTGRAITIEPPPDNLAALDITVPGDISSAAFLLTAAAIVPGSRITVTNVGVNPTRSGLVDALQRMGVHIEQEAQAPAGSEAVAHLHVAAGPLTATTIGGAEIPRLIDELPILAVAATQAHGVTMVRDAAELRVKESDRISALAPELRKLGARIEEFADGFAIEGPTRLQGAVVDSHKDHRLAMALAVAGLVATGETTISDAACIGDSYPEFTATLAALGVAL